MSEAYEPRFDLESLLADALRPIDPPESLVGRVETTLSRITVAAASEFSDWAEELTESELQSLRDPRNWVRPVAAGVAGGAAGMVLILMGSKRRRKPTGVRAFTEDVVGRISRER